jgi:D-alanine-D-alanine ligase
MSRKVAVLLGGRSAEREVSLVSGEACAAALARQGWTVTAVDPQSPLWIDELQAFAPDCVFNALHGLWGEDGRIQGVLEYLGLAYTHSGVLASALAMDKTRAKTVLEAAGLQTPPGRLVKSAEIARAHPMEPPYVVKPNAEGSSVGVFIVREGANAPLGQLADPDWPHEEMLVEKFIPGRELTVAVMDDRPLTVTEITTRLEFYDYEAKYAAGGSEHVLPALIPAEVADAAMEQALRAHRAMGCRGLTRSDFRWTGEGALGLWLLEINTQPGMTPTSLAPEQAAHCGIAFDDLVNWMAEEASCPR